MKGQLLPLIETDALRLRREPPTNSAAKLPAAHSNLPLLLKHVSVAPITNLAQGALQRDHLHTLWRPHSPRLVQEVTLHQVIHSVIPLVL